MTLGTLKRLVGTTALAAPLVVLAASDKPADMISIYPQGAAVVSDTQTLALDKGINNVDWVATGHVDPATFWLGGGDVSLAGLATAAHQSGPDNPLVARVGRSVTLQYRAETVAGRSTHTRRRGTLMSVADGDAFVRVGKRVLRITPNSPWQISWPAGDSRPDDRAESNTLDLRVTDASAGEHSLRATYQISGLNWQASTTGHFDADQGTLIFHSMAVIHNTSDRALNTQKAALIAGDINRASNHRPHPIAMAARQKQADTGDPTPVGHGYRYALTRGLHIAAGQTRAVAIVDRTTVKAKRQYVIDNRFNSQTRKGHPQHARVQLTFNNDSGQPLPAGAFRVYGQVRSQGQNRDKSHYATLLGAGRIGNTPTHAPVTINLGRAFDITATRRITSNKRDAGGANHRTIVIEVSNAGTKKTAVSLVEHLPDNARIVSSSASPATGSSADQARWALDVPGGGESQLRYEVRWPHD